MDQETIHRRRWYILGVLVLSLLVVVLDNSILNVALKTIAEPAPIGLGASQADLAWAVNTYTLAFAGLLITWGVIGDRYGRKRILLLGMVLFGLASLLSSFSHSPGELIAARAFMGFAGAAVMPSTLSIITNVFEPQERPRAIAIWAGAVGLAIAIGPITGGALLAHFWWGSVFLINVPIVAVAVLAMSLVVPDSKNPHPGRLDPVGVVLSMLALVGLVFGIIRGGDLSSVTATSVWLPFLGGVVMLAAFIAWERHTDHPAIDMAFFRDARFSAAVASIGLVFFALMGVTFFLVFYTQIVRGYSAFQTGLLLLPLAAAQMIFAPRSATLVRRFGVRAVATGGMALVCLTFLAFTLLEADTPIWILEVLLVVQGMGMANVMPPATESIMQAVPREKAGVGSAVNNTVRQVGGALGVSILSTVLTAVYRPGIKPQIDHVLAQIPGIPDRGAVAQGVSSSLEGTTAFIQQAPNQAPPAAQGQVRQLVGSLLHPAEQAFLHAMHYAAVGSAIAAFIGVVVAVRFLPRRPSPTGMTQVAPAGETSAKV